MEKAWCVDHFPATGPWETTPHFKSARASVALNFLSHHSSKIEQLAVKAGMFPNRKNTGVPAAGSGARTEPQPTSAASLAALAVTEP